MIVEIVSLYYVGCLCICFVCFTTDILGVEEMCDISKTNDVSIEMYDISKTNELEDFELIN